MTTVRIEEWHAEHPRWNEVTSLIKQLGQTDWVAFNAEWHLSSHMLVAHTTEGLLGFLRYVVQEIGVEEDLSPITLNNAVLTEGKVIAFGVATNKRRQGIGRALQDQLIHDCRARGCFQIRSHSDEANIENYQLKLSLGFAIHPLIRTDRKNGAYFLLPLGTAQDQPSEDQKSE